jgi:hypothetical protein
MKTYFAISSDMKWVQFGSYQRCFSLALEFSGANLDRSVCIGQMRPAEERAWLLFEVSSAGFIGIEPPKFLSAKALRRAHRAVRGKSCE